MDSATFHDYARIRFSNILSNTFILFVYSLFRIGEYSVNFMRLFALSLAAYTALARSTLHTQSAAPPISLALADCIQRAQINASARSFCEREIVIW